MGTWFSAKRDGKCAHCKKAITKDDEVYQKSKGVTLCGECGLVADNTPSDRGSIEEGVERDLAQFPPEVHEQALAQVMLYLAKQLDQGEVSPRDVGTVTKEIRMNLMQLRELYPPAEGEDETDQARARLERRRREQGGI